MFARSYAGGVFFSGFSATIASVVTSMCRGTNGSNPSPSSGESDEIEDGLKSSYAADLKLRGSVSFHRRQDNPALPILSQKALFCRCSIATCWR